MPISGGQPEVLTQRRKRRPVAHSPACLQDRERIRTRPYTPRTNGKAERFIQTLLREWAYRYCYPTSEYRATELPLWMHFYNFHRPHSATADKPPVSRLRFIVNNVSRTYS